MANNTKIVFISLCMLFFNKMVFSSPWFTGPILAPAGHTIPKGHTNFELYGFDTLTTGQYDDSGDVHSTPLFTTLLPYPLLTHGFTDWMDVQLGVPYVFSSTQGVHYNHIADVGLTLGLQLIEQKKHKSLPDFRFTVQETFPTGKFQELNPLLLGTDATGYGSYITTVGLNFQYLAEIFKSHYLRTRFVLSRLFYSSTQINGFNAFGGSAITNGTAHLGTDNNIDLAFEYTVTQNWVAVMEGYYSDGTPITFDGIFTPSQSGKNLTIVKRFYEVGLAPALEYNFNSNVGIIGGVWFPIAGQNTSYYMTYVLAINAYW